MKINIICSEVDGGWIYSRFIVKFCMHSRNKIFVNSKEKCAVDYYIPYYEFNKKDKRPVSAWFSHQENLQPLKDKFISVSKQCDFCISHSNKYAEIIKDNGIVNVKQIIPGVDLNRYKIQPFQKSNKLIVGWCGRSYTSSNRKNKSLLEKIEKLPFVELRITGGKIKESDMPDFYSKCGLIVQTSLVEGGSMSHLESLACGKPFICYDDVGTSREFKNGTITVPFNNEEAFLNRIVQFWNNKEFDVKLEERELMRSQIRDWPQFISDHDDIFERLVDEKNKQLS